MSKIFLVVRTKRIVWNGNDLIVSEEAVVINAWLSEGHAIADARELSDISGDCFDIISLDIADSFLLDFAT